MLEKVDLQISAYERKLTSSQIPGASPMEIDSAVDVIPGNKDSSEPAEPLDVAMPQAEPADVAMPQAEAPINVAEIPQEDKNGLQAMKGTDHEITQVRMNMEDFKWHTRTHCRK